MNNKLIACCKLLIGILFFIISNRAFCQFDENATYVPPSPSASAILKYANTPVNMYTGVPSVNPELHTLTARGGFKFPIFLNYHASGIKVQDVSNNVGIGWSLSTDCMITRILRGLPDESANGYFGSTMGDKITHLLDTVTMNGIINNTLDAEPDLFYYSLNGLYGKFVFNKNGGVVMLSDNNIRILNTPFKKELGVDGWILEDLQGNMFYLGTNASSIENTQATAYGEASHNEYLQFNSTWYLTKIVTSNNIETINFNYDSGNPIKITNYRKRQKFRNKITATFNKGVYFFGIPLSQPSVTTEFQTTDLDTWDNNIEEIISNPRYLVSIVTSNESAYFVYNSQNNRMDLPYGWILKKIIIKDYKGESLKSFGLNQDYFYSAKDVDYLESVSFNTINTLDDRINNSSDMNQIIQWQAQVTQVKNLLTSSTETLSDAQYLNQLNTITQSNAFQPLPATPDRYRLRLNAVTLYLGNNSSSSLQLYNFQYNNLVNLPPRYSKKMDHWGYYNNNTYGYFPGDVNVFGYPTGNATIDEASKQPDTGRMKANMLQKITYETGAYKLFLMEANSAYNSVSSINRIIGGLRVAQIVNAGDSFTKPLIEKYTYVDNLGNSTGKLINPTPIYVSYIEHSESQILYVPAPYTAPTSIPPFTQMHGDVVSPIPMNTFNWASIATVLQNLVENGFTQSQTRYTPFIIRNSTSVNELLDVDGIAVGYSQVTQEHMGQGKTVNLFSDINDYPDYTNQLRVDKNFITVGRISPNLCPYTPATSYSCARGYLKQSLVYDKNLNLLRRTTNNYSFNTVADSVKGFKCSIGKITTINGAFQSINTFYYNIGNYYNVSKQLLQTQTTEENFVTGNGTPIVKTSTFSYNAPYPSLIGNQTVQNSDGNIYSTNYKYVLNKDQVTYSNQSEIDAANKLFNDGKFGVLLDQTTTNNTKILTSNKIGYRNWLINGNTLTLPEILYRNSGSTIVPKVQYYSYNQYGNVLNFGYVSGAKKSFQYGNNFLYPVAQAINATSNDIFYDGFEDGNGNSSLGDSKTGHFSFLGSYTKSLTGLDIGIYMLTYWIKSGGIWSLQTSAINVTTNAYTISISGQIDDVRFVPVNCQLVTYTFDSWLGMTSSTDLKNNATYYEYDILQRLINVKDQLGNIVKSYGYNYANQPISPNPVNQLYFNTPRSSVYTSACSSGYYGSPVTYSIDAGTYSSTISQNDADQQAQNDLDTNGQAFANGSHGLCSNLFSMINTSSVGFTVTFSAGSNINFNFPPGSNMNVQIPPGTYTLIVSPSGSPVSVQMNLGQRQAVFTPGYTFNSVVIGPGGTDFSLKIQDNF
jgi:hypothetical protein